MLRSFGACVVSLGFFLPVLDVACWLLDTCTVFQASRTHTLCVVPVVWHSYHFFGILGFYVITRLRVRQDRFLLIKYRYLCCICSVIGFNLDKLQEVRPLRVVVFMIRSYARVSGHPVYD